MLDELGHHDVLQLLVEGGPTTTSAFFEAGLVNHVVWYQAAGLGRRERNARGAERPFDPYD